MAPQRSLRVGLAGCGAIAQYHLRAYAQRDDVRVAAVCDVDEARAGELAARLGARGYGRYEEMLAATGEDAVDAVDVCLPHHLHKDAIVAAARAGKHVLCEKPLCLGLDEAAEIERAVADAGVTLMCAHNMLYLATVRRARALLDEGVLGTVYEVRTSETFRDDSDPATFGWRASRELTGGGELIDTGYHPCYLLLHLMDSEPVEVTAVTSRHRLTFMEGEDSAQLLVRFASGAVGHVATSWAYEAPRGTGLFSVVGEHGCLHGTPDELRCDLLDRDPDAVTVENATADAFAAEIEDFVLSVRKGRRPLHDHHDGIAVLRLILGAYESAETKRTVALA